MEDDKQSDGILIPFARFASLFPAAVGAFFSLRVVRVFAGGLFTFRMFAVTIITLSLLMFPVITFASFRAPKNSMLRIARWTVEATMLLPALYVIGETVAFYLRRADDSCGYMYSGGFVFLVPQALAVGLVACVALVEVAASCSAPDT